MCVCVCVCVFMLRGEFTSSNPSSEMIVNFCHQHGKKYQKEILLITKMVIDNNNDN